MKTIDAKDIRPFFKCFVDIADATYATPTEAWVTGPMKQKYEKTLQFLELETWETWWDCDGFSSLYYCIAQIIHAQRHSTKAQGQAVGEVWYEQDSGQHHAINCVITDKRELKFIEPQGPKWMTLSPKEQKNIYYVRF